MVDSFAPLLARIDDRLIHGQVVVGCCEPLGASGIVLVDDEVAQDALQQKLYRAAAPPSVDVRFVAVDAARERLEELASTGLLDRVLVVVARALTMHRLHEAGVAFRSIQLGGAHAREGAHELVPGFFLDDEDRRALRMLLESGVEVFIQPVAASAKQTLGASMLEGGAS